MEWKGERGENKRGWEREETDGERQDAGTHLPNFSAQNIRERRKPV